MCAESERERLSIKCSKYFQCLYFWVRFDFGGLWRISTIQRSIYKCVCNSQLEQKFICVCVGELMFLCLFNSELFTLK